MQSYRPINEIAHAHHSPLCDGLRIGLRLHFANGKPIELDPIKPGGYVRPAADSVSPADARRQRIV